jgi:hypothetical protein
MLTLERGDRIEILFEDSPEASIHGTVARVLTDSEAGMGAEVLDYIACWAEILVDEPGDGPAQHTIELCTDLQCRLNGRPITLRKKHR